jgi:hypothetical protein
MTLRITIDIFSGRPNPVIGLSGEQSKRFLTRIKPAAMPAADLMPNPDFRLGYRGLIVEQTRHNVPSLPRTFRVAAGAVYTADAAPTIADPGLEEDFFASRGAGAKVKIPGIADPGKLLRKAVKDLARIRDEYVRARHRDRRHRPHHRHPRCACAPLYEPAWWNDGGQRQLGNNCYNYACDYRTDTFAQPGQASGAMYTSLTCASVRSGAIADDLIANPGANNRCPKEGHLVALVIWPGVDFHWYRKGRSGLWSHKPGPTAVRDVDNSGHLIDDPRTADRDGYVTFCTFMTVMHGHIKIR